MTQQGMTYAGSGVDYEGLDSFKTLAQAAARLTVGNVPGVTVDEESLGESARLLDVGPFYITDVLEGLGTKNLAADKAEEELGATFYRGIAQCNAAMIVNDLITTGALPIGMNLYVAVESADWFKNEQRARALVDGFKNACDLAGAIWLGGETPALRGVISPGAADLAGSAIGMTVGKRRISSKNLAAGDVIIILQSNGIHANGLTLARAIADKLPGGYKTQLPDGTSLGEALLAPTHIYVDIVRDLMEDDCIPSYAANITGHGWRKFMRAPQSFTYRIHTLPEDPHDQFSFLMEHGPVDLKEAYGNLNMGAGFALFLPLTKLRDFWQVYDSKPRAYKAIVAGFVEEGPKRVLIQPVGIEFSGEELDIRA